MAGKFWCYTESHSLNYSPRHAPKVKKSISMMNIKVNNTLKGSWRSWDTPTWKIFVEIEWENFSLFSLLGLKLLYLTKFQTLDMNQCRAIRSSNFQFRNFCLSWSYGNYPWLYLTWTFEDGLKSLDRFSPIVTTIWTIGRWLSGRSLIIISWFSGICPVIHFSFFFLSLIYLFWNVFFSKLRSTLISFYVVQMSKTKIIIESLIP